MPSTYAIDALLAASRRAAASADYFDAVYLKAYRAGLSEIRRQQELREWLDDYMVTFARAAGLPTHFLRTAWCEPFNPSSTPEPVMSDTYDHSTPIAMGTPCLREGDRVRFYVPSQPDVVARVRIAPASQFPWGLVLEYADRKRLAAALGVSHDYIGLIFDPEGSSCVLTMPTRDCLVLGINRIAAALAALPEPAFHTSAATLAVARAADRIRFRLTNEACEQAILDRSSGMWCLRFGWTAEENRAGVRRVMDALDLRSDVDLRAFLRATDPVPMMDGWPIYHDMQRALDDARRVFARLASIRGGVMTPEVKPEPAPVVIPDRILERAAQYVADRPWKNGDRAVLIPEPTNHQPFCPNSPFTVALAHEAWEVPPHAIINYLAKRHVEAQAAKERIAHETPPPPGICNAAVLDRSTPWSVLADRVVAALRAGLRLRSDVRDLANKAA